MIQVENVTFTQKMRSSRFLRVRAVRQTPCHTAVLHGRRLIGNIDGDDADRVWVRNFHSWPPGFQVWELRRCAILLCIIVVGLRTHVRDEIGGPRVADRRGKQVAGVSRPRAP